MPQHQQLTRYFESRVNCGGGSGILTHGSSCRFITGKHLFMADEKLIVNDRPHEYGMRRAVDVFFRTFASTHNRSRPQSSFQAETATAQSASCGSKRVEDALSHRTLGKHRTKGCHALEFRLERWIGCYYR
jgi:hypothetical protein